jgi:hypothetical protein
MESESRKILARAGRSRSKAAYYAFSGTFKALAQTIANFALLKPFLWVALGVAGFCVVGEFWVFVISRTIGYIALAIYDVCREINKILSNEIFNDVVEGTASVFCTLLRNKKCLRYAQNHTSGDFVPIIKLGEVKTIAQLAFGQCRDFDTPVKVFRYFFLLTAGTEICDNLAWYESLTLTKYLVYTPARLVFWTDSTGSCRTTTTTNLCAFAGTELIFDFILKDVIVSFVIVVGCWPLIRNAVKFVSNEFHYFLYEIRYLSFRLHPNKRWKPSLPSFLSRRHLHLSNRLSDD